MKLSDTLFKPDELKNGSPVPVDLQDAIEALDVAYEVGQAHGRAEAMGTAGWIMLGVLAFGIFFGYLWAWNAENNRTNLCNMGRVEYCRELPSERLDVGVDL